MKTILVVEDTLAIREEICDILKMENFNVLEAKNGLEGLHIAKENIPDLILSDILMPVLDGFQFIKELKKYAATENIPVIFLSAKANKDDIREGMNLGADDYLTKPLSPDDLLISINNKLEKQERFDKKMQNLRENISNFLPHELRTPLNGILGFSDYLRENYQDIDRIEVINIAYNIFESGKRLQRLVENYTIYSNLNIKLNNGSKLAKIKDVGNISTNKIINEVINNEKNIEFREKDIFLELEDQKIKIEEYYFRKIIEELLSNAIKFTIAGIKIQIKTEVVDNELVLTVRNEGSGITEEQIADIGAFMQFDRKKNEQQGLGLGLAIVKLIAELYNANFIVNSKPYEFFEVIINFKLK